MTDAPHDGGALHKSGTASLAGGCVSECAPSPLENQRLAETWQRLQLAAHGLDNAENVGAARFAYRRAHAEFCKAWGLR